MEGVQFYYAFPATSKDLTKKVRYVNIVFNIRTNKGKSLIMLDEIYRLPKENVKNYFAYMVVSYENVLFKKLKDSWMFK